MRLSPNISLFILLSFSSCQKRNYVGDNKFSDSTMAKIWDLKDRRLADSLHPYFVSNDATYRRDAALAFSSIQDSTGVIRIGNLLMRDESTAVRSAAALALGQTPCHQSELILSEAFEKENEVAVRREIIESYGKVTKHWKLDVAPEDSILSDALAWSLYRYGLNRMGDTAVNAKAATLLDTSFNELTRLGSAHHFARSAKDIERFHRILIASAQQDPSADVRMASTLALRKIKTKAVLNATVQILQEEKDYRVRINAFRVLQSFPLEETMDHLAKGLSDENVNAGIAASEVIKASATKDFWTTLLTLARSSKNWRIQANLYEATLTVANRKELVDEISANYLKTMDPYHKAALLIVLQHSMISYGFVADQLFHSDIPVIKSSAAGALVAMNHHKNFDPALRRKFAACYSTALHSGDPGVIGIIATALADSSLGYKDEISDFSFLYAARKKLSLPKDIEAVQPLEAAIARFEGRKIPVPVKNEFNHPIDWRLVKMIKKDQKAVISTTKGDVCIRLFVEEAPGSVANFIALTNQGYFNNRFFHRVVPNFVIQGGCNRGDGFGSEAYSIRSEFTARRYKTGSVGMASSGKDTEGTQWFITHSSTPHLDGRYTIFAEVESGMEVVHHIEVGDKILKIELK
jgi:cyclophilin family peptidyl-prolyl cis-trans isomerase/HEAT repeat protein